MAKITLANGTVFNGTAKECEAFMNAQASRKNTTKGSANKSKNTTTTRKSSKVATKGKGNTGDTLAKKALKAFAPKKSSDGEYSWKSYDAQRTHYCYYVATKGKAKSSKECKALGIYFANIKDAYYKARADYEKQYVYVPIAER